MATGDKVYLADKETLDTVKTTTDEINGKVDDINEKLDSQSGISDINTKLGTTTDPVGSTSQGSVMAKLNKIISDVGTHMNRWTSARAEKIDNIGASGDGASATGTTLFSVLKQVVSLVGTDNSASNTGKLSQKLSYIIGNMATSSKALSSDTWTSTKAGYLDASISSRAPSSTALSTAQWTNTRAGYLDKLSTGVSIQIPTTSKLTGATSLGSSAVSGTGKGLLIIYTGSNTPKVSIDGKTAVDLASNSSGDPTTFHFYFSTSFSVTASTGSSGSKCVVQYFS